MGKHQRPTETRRTRRRWKFIALLAALFVLGAAASYVGAKYVGRWSKERPTLTIFTGREPPGLNPLVLADPTATELADLFYDPLVRVDAAGRTVPALATAWTSPDGGATWTVRLRDAVTWSDGRRLTADDVTFTYTTLTSPEFDFNAGGFWCGYKVAKLDALTVRFTLPAADAFFPWRLTVPILPRAQLEGIPYHLWPGHATARQPVGTGPFILEDWKAGRSLTARANPDYWGGAPGFSRVEVRFTPLDGREVGAGVVDAAKAVALGKDRRFEVIAHPGPSYFLIALNQRAGTPGAALFGDSRVREALATSLDRGKVIEAVGVKAYPLSSPFLPGLWPAAARDPGGQGPGGRVAAPDLDRARALLTAAGWQDSDGDGVLDRDGRPFRFTLLAPKEPAPGLDRPAAAQEVARQWSRLGVVANVKVAPLADLFAAMAPPFAYEAMLSRFVIAPDPDVIDVFASDRIPGVEPDGLLTGGANFSSYSDPHVDAILSKAGRTTDPAALQGAYTDLAAALAADPPAVFLWGEQSYYAVPRGLRGAAPGPFGALWNIGEWRLGR